MSQISSSTIGKSQPAADDHGYNEYMERLQARFLTNLHDQQPVLFTTDVSGLFDTYLNALPGERQYHNCHCCRRFIETFGGLAVITDKNQIRSAVWHEADAPEYYMPAVAWLARFVAKARITGVFLSSEKVWGPPRTGPWTHFSVTPPIGLVHPTGTSRTPGQAMAEKREDYINVSRALGEYTLPMLDQVMRLLESESLYRSEKLIGPARWLHKLRADCDATADRRGRENLVWKAIATAPAGFCHPRSSMIGTLLDDVVAGLDFQEISRKFAAKMNPLQYQRPSAAPSAGNIAAAEKLVETLGITPSLARRFARLEDVESIWRPTVDPAAAPPAGVFAHLKPKEPLTVAEITIPPLTMTWEKFARTVLPTARALEYYATPQVANYAALITAVHPEAPPILQWDTLERRNPVSWYLYNGGSGSALWNLEPSRYHRVTAVTRKPPHWGTAGNPFPVNSHQVDGAFLLLEGAWDTRSSGLGLFPEILKHELREIRATIEAYSRTAVLAGREEATACGILIEKINQPLIRLRARSGNSWQEYRIDRWD